MLRGCCIWGVSGVLVRLLLSATHVSSNLQPNQSFKNQAVSSPTVLYLTNHLFLCSCPLQKHSPVSFNHHIPSPSLSHFLILSFPLSLSLSFDSLLFCPFALCCFAAQLDRLSRLPLVVLPWLCDDCVLYQSVTCVLAQPPPVPCTHRVDLCAAAALTDRRAA